MCGLLGFSGTKAADIDKLRFLFLCNMERGSDSTGVCGKQLFKIVGNASLFLQNPGFATAVTNSKLVIGHTRKKSVGTINKESAHPFRIGTGDDVLYGTHNGTIQKYYLDKAVEYFKLPAQEVDSLFIYEALYANRKKNGDLDFGKVLPFIHGAMALAFKYRGSLYLYRRDGYTLGRPIHLGTTKSGVYYSSEKTPLLMLGITDINEVPADKVFQIKDGVIINSIDVKESTANAIPATQSQIGFKHDDRYASRSVISLYDIQAEKSTKQIGMGNREAVLANMGSDNDSYTPLSPILDKDALAYWGRSMDRCIASFTEIPIELKQVEDIDHSTYDSSILLINVFTTSLKEILPLSDWMVFLQKGSFGDETRHWGITNNDGVVVLELPEDTFTKREASFEIGMYDPVWGQEYFSGTIDIKQGRVLEVALSIPFRKSNIYKSKRRRSNTSKRSGSVEQRYDENGKASSLHNETSREKDDGANQLRSGGRPKSNESSDARPESRRVLEFNQDGTIKTNEGESKLALFNELDGKSIPDGQFQEYLEDCWDWVYDMKNKAANWGKMYSSSINNERYAAYHEAQYHPGKRVIISLLSDILSEHPATRSFNFSSINVSRLFEDCAIMNSFWGKDVFAMPFTAVGATLLHDEVCFEQRYELNNLKVFDDAPTDTDEPNLVEELGVDWVKNHIFLVAASGGIDVGVASRETTLEEFEEAYVLGACSDCDTLIKSCRSSPKKIELTKILDYLQQLSYDCKAFLSSKTTRSRLLTFSAEERLILKHIATLKKLLKNAKAADTIDAKDNLLAFFECIHELLTATNSNFKIKYLV